MITAIINVLQQVAPVTGKDYGLCTIETDESGKRTIVQYVGGGQARRVEGETFSYWRVTGKVTQKRRDDLSGCEGSTQYIVPLRYVIAVSRDLCGPEQLTEVAARMRRVGKSIETALTAIMVELPGASVEVDPAKGMAEVLDTPIPLHIGVGYIDISVEVTGDRCIETCEPIAVVVDQSSSCLKMGMF